jgi:hypothetical protein
MPPTEAQRATCARKKRFTSQAVAAAEVAHTKARAAAGEARRRECRAYPCLICFGWHLTSQPPRADGSGVQPLPEEK